MENSAKIARYQSIITDYLESLAGLYNHMPGLKLEYQVIADRERGHFQLVKLGWFDRRYTHMVLLHFDVKPDGKVWIQLNDTEMLVGEELSQRGIAHSDIVLGFKPEYVRPYTGFAVA